MASEEALRAQRQALAAAVNARDLDGVKTFIHPSFVSKTAGGSVISRDDLLTLFLEPMFRTNRDWREDIKIEEIRVSGDTAALTVSRSHWHSPSWVMKVLTLGQTGTHSGVARSRETWQFVDGRWQMVEQQELDTAAA